MERTHTRTTEELRQHCLSLPQKARGRVQAYCEGLRQVRWARKLAATSLPLASSLSCLQLLDMRTLACFR